MFKALALGASGVFVSERTMQDILLDGGFFHVPYLLIFIVLPAILANTKVLCAVYHSIKQVRIVLFSNNSAHIGNSNLIRNWWRILIKDPDTTYSFGQAWLNNNAGGAQYFYIQCVLRFSELAIFSPGDRLEGRYYFHWLLMVRLESRKYFRCFTTSLS